jgi:hypothetical protein
MNLRIEYRVKIILKLVQLSQYFMDSSPRQLYYINIQSGVYLASGNLIIKRITREFFYLINHSSIKYSFEYSSVTIDIKITTSIEFLF